MPIPAPIRATPSPAPRPPAGPGAAAAPGALEPARQMLERAWRLPAAPGAARPPAGPGLLRSLGLAGAVAAGALFNSSGGELALLQLQGRVPQDIGLRQWQRAGAALERWSPHWRLPSSATPQQLGQLVRRAAELEEQLSGRQLTPQQFRRAMGELVRGLQTSPGPRATAPAVTTPAAAPRSPAPPPAARPQPQALAAQALARLREALHAHQATPTARTRDTLNDELAHTASLHRQHGARWPAETAARYGELGPRARSALAQPLHAARAGEAVQQLGRALRAFNTQPADPARRDALNDAFALARSLQANRNEWTPATRRNFDALAPQAVRALYGPARPDLPAQRSETAHTRGAGARTGEGAAELEQRSRSRQAQALETARRQVHEQRRTLLPGGSLETLARRVHAALGGAAALGVSADEFVAGVREPGPIRGADAAGRVRSGTAGAGSGTGAAFGPRGEGPRERERAIVLAINTLVNDTIRSSLSPQTQEGRDRLVELLARRDWALTLQDALVLPGASERVPPMPVTIRLHRVDGGVHVNARLDPARSIDALTGSRAYFAPLGKPATAFYVDHTLAVRGGRILLPLEPRAADPALVNPWGAGGLPNPSGDFGLPPNFFDPRLDAGRFGRQVASAPGLDASWVPSPTQHRQFMNLFAHRQALGALLNPPRPYPSHDAALGTLVDALRAMDRQPRTRPMFPVELSFHVFPAKPDGSEWGIGFGALGRDRSVGTFPTRLGAGFGERPPGPQMTTLHTHPTHRGTRPSGFSLADVSCALSTGTSVALYDNGVGMRIRLDEAWFASGAQTRRARVDALDALSKQFEALKGRADRLAASPQDPAGLAAERRGIASERDRLDREARRQLAELPIVFEVIGGVPHPERTAAVVMFGKPVLPLSQARAR